MKGKMTPQLKFSITPKVCIIQKTVLIQDKIPLNRSFKWY